MFLRSPFHERAEDMGLTCHPQKLQFSYSDRYGQIVYRQLITDSDPTDQHDTDRQLVPILAIFTSSGEQLGFKYCGYVSDFYQFIGNDVLNQQIRDAIQEVGIPILTENTILDGDLTRMRNEIIIQSSQNVAGAGDVLPVMIVNNSYNGTKAATISFGIATQHNRDRLIFSFGLGEMRQVHIVNSNAQMSSVVSSYMNVFSEHIFDLITESFRSRLTAEQMLSILDVIEDLGKGRRDQISKYLEEINPTTEGETIFPSAWQMFLAIVRYSSFEPNLNMKRLLENAAESVLVIPTRMYEVLERLNTS